MVESHVTNISRYERGEHKPTTEMLTKLADVLGVTTDFLISGSVNDMAQTTISDKELLMQFQEIEKLPNDRKYIIKELIDAFIFKTKVKMQLL